MNALVVAVAGQVCNLPSSGPASGRLQACPTVIMIIALAVSGLVRGDELVPLPPLPEDVVIDPAVVPAALETGRPLSAALPLDAAPPAGGSAAARPLSTGPLGDWTVLAAIAAAFCLLGVYRFQQTRRRGRTLPADVFEVLGEASLGGPHAVRVVRFGPRTLLVGVSATGCQTLASLDDPQVTDRIVAACLGERIPRPASVPQPAARPASTGPKRQASGEEAA